MKREELKKLGLSDEQIESVMVLQGKAFESKVDKAELETAQSTIQNLQDQMKVRDEQLKELQAKAAGNADLSKQITDLQAANKAAQDKFDADLKAARQAHLLDLAVAGAKPKNATALKALLDTSKLKFKDDAVEGLDEQLAALKQSDAYLFEDNIPNGTGAPAASGGSGPQENAFAFNFGGVRPAPSTQTGNQK